MRDYHSIQMTGTFCQGKNCAAATGAMDVFFGTRGAVEMTADSFRNASGVSCVPGKDTPSGGLDVAAIERVCAKAGVDIDFRGTSWGLRRWNSTEIYARLSTFYFGHLLGMYSTVKAPWRAKGSTFMGGHSAGAHDVRDDLPDSHYGIVQRTACWHDPLRKRPIRVPYSVIEAYTGSNTDLKGYAGWVKIAPVGSGRYAHPMTDRTRTDYATVAVHRDRTKGAASTIRVIRGKGTLVELAMYAEGESYNPPGPEGREATWGALSLLGNEWINLGRLRREGGST